METIREIVEKMTQDDVKVGVYSMSAGAIIRVVETEAIKFKPVGDGRMLYLATWGQNLAPVWKAEDCKDIDLGTEIDVDFIRTVD